MESYGERTARASAAPRLASHYRPACSASTPRRVAILALSASQRASISAFFLLAAAEPAPRLEGMSMQNCANLLWGFAKLNYQPATVLPHVADALLLPGMLESAKHVEVADLGFALGVVARPGECRELLQALAARAAPETTLRYLSSRQICKLIDTFARLDATAELPEGLLDAWIGIVRVAHAETPLMARDARLLEGSLKKLDVDATWVRKSAVLSAWKAAMTGAKAVKA